MAMPLGQGEMMSIDDGAHAASGASLAITAALAIVAFFLSGCSDARPAVGDHAPSSRIATSGAVFPSDVAGLKFGITREEARKVCDGAGLEVHLHEREFAGVGSVSAITCVGLPKPDPSGEFAYVEGLFCKDSLCVVKLAGYDGARFEPLRDAMVARYGAVRADYSDVPSRCAGDALVKCLQDGTARRLLVWSWTAGFPASIVSMIRLVHTASAQGEYVFLFFCNAAGSDLIAETAKQGTR